MDHVDEGKADTLLGFEILRLIEVIILPSKLLVNQRNHISLCKVIDGNISYHERRHGIFFSIENTLNVYLIVHGSFL